MGVITICDAHNQAFYKLYIQSSPQWQYRRSRGRRKSGGIRKAAVKGVILYNQEKHYFGLENGRWYWGGWVGGERRAVVGRGPGDSIQ